MTSKSVVKEASLTKLSKAPLKGKIIDFAFGAALGVLAFWLLYGFATLDVSYDAWIYHGYIESDVLQHYGGWLFYRAADWGWPLLRAANISIPYGASVVFTDSIPLFAVIFKFLSPILPETFQYFGWYSLINFILQGGIGVLLLRYFKLERWCALLGSALFLSMPIFVERAFRHIALGSQWLILLALLLYFKARHEEKFPVLGFAFVCALSTSIHFYFTPILYALFAVALVERAFKDKKWVRYILYLISSFAFTLACMYVLGYFHVSSGEGEGFGTYSMNLNAMFNPRSFDSFSDAGYVSWSRFIPVLPQQERQYDGFNYAGLGMLLAGAAVLVYVLVRMLRKDKSFTKAVFEFVRSHAWLIAACTMLTLFALSNTVYLGQMQLISLPLPKGIISLFSSFRSSGRMFWLCMYLMMTGVVVFAGRMLKGRGKVMAICLVVAVQLLDISPALMAKSTYFRGERMQMPSSDYQSEEWQFLMESYDVVYCLEDMLDYELAASMITANPDILTNMKLTNRGIFPANILFYEPEVEALSGGRELQNGVLYITGRKETYEKVLAGLHPAARAYKIAGYFFFANPVQGNSMQGLRAADMPSVNAGSGFFGAHRQVWRKPWEKTWD